MRKQNKMEKNHTPTGKSFMEFRFLIQSLKADFGTNHKTSNSAGLSSAIQTTDLGGDRLGQCQSVGVSVPL